METKEGIGNRKRKEWKKRNKRRKAATKASERDA